MYNRDRVIHLSRGRCVTVGALERTLGADAAEAICYAIDAIDEMRRVSWAAAQAALRVYSRELLAKLAEAGYELVPRPMDIVKRPANADREPVELI